MENGKMAVVPKLSNGLGFGSTEFHVLRPHEGIDSRYIYYFVSSQSFRREAAHRMTGAVGQKRVPLPFLEETLIPVPVFDDQKRIVAEIEKQFSRLDEAVANLKRVKANLKRYKSAVLKAAVEGKLTEGWRKAHPDIEPASKLLDRILTQRRTKWKGKGKYKEPSAPGTTDLPALPKGWTGATVEQLSMLVQYGSSAKTHEEAVGVPVLRMGNIEGARLRVDSLKYLPKNHHEFPELFLREGDILFNRTNSAELVGKTAVYKGKPDPCSFASYLIRVRLVQGCASDLLAYFINSVFGRAWIAQVVSQQVGQANVNGTKLQALAVPLPSLDEQEQIVAEVERRLSVIEELEATVEANIKRADRLRQAILQRAFAGQLVSQGLNEPVHYPPKSNSKGSNHCHSGMESTKISHHY
jgi:type I restriction enzyme S subunit